MYFFAAVNLLCSERKALLPGLAGTLRGNMDRPISGGEEMRGGSGVKKPAARTQRVAGKADEG